MVNLKIYVKRRIRSQIIPILDKLVTSHHISDILLKPKKYFNQREDSQEISGSHDMV